MTNYRSNRDRFLEYDKNRLNDIFEVDLKNQSRVIDKQTNTRINNRLKTDNLITKWYQHIDTMYDLLLHSVECFGDLPFLGTRKFPENEYKSGLKYTFPPFHLPPPPDPPFPPPPWSFEGGKSYFSCD